MNNDIKESAVSKKDMAKKGVSLFLVLALLITGLFAFLTATDSKTNVFTIGNLKAELWENFDTDNDKTLQNDETFDSSDKEVEMEVPIVPGDEILKQPFVKNTGSNPGWTYLAVSIPTASRDDIKSDASGNVSIAGSTQEIDIKAIVIQDHYGDNDAHTMSDVWTAYGYDVDGDADTASDISNRVPVFSIVDPNSSWTQIGDIIQSDDGHDYYVFGYNTLLQPDAQTSICFRAVKLEDTIGNPNVVNVTYYYQTSADPGSSGSGAGEANLSETAPQSVEFDGKTYEYVNGKTVPVGTKLGKLYYDVNVMDERMSYPTYRDITHLDGSEAPEVQTTTVINDDTQIIIDQVPNEHNAEYFDNVVPEEYYVYYVTDNNELVFLGIHEDYLSNYLSTLNNLMLINDSELEAYDAMVQHDASVLDAYYAQETIDYLDDMLYNYEDCDEPLITFKNGRVTYAVNSPDVKADIQQKIDVIQRVLYAQSTGTLNVSQDEIESFENKLEFLRNEYNEIEQLYQTTDSPFVDISLPSKVTPEFTFKMYNDARVWWSWFDTANPRSRVVLSWDNARVDSGIPVKTAHGYFVGNTNNLSMSTSYPVTCAHYNNCVIGSIGNTYAKAFCSWDSTPVTWQFNYNTNNYQGDAQLSGMREHFGTMVNGEYVPYTYTAFVNTSTIQYNYGYVTDALGKNISGSGTGCGFTEAGVVETYSYAMSDMGYNYDDYWEQIVMPFIVTNTFETSLSDSYSVNGKNFDAIWLENDNATKGEIMYYDDLEQGHYTGSPMTTSQESHVSPRLRYGCGIGWWKAEVKNFVLRTNNSAIAPGWNNIFIHEFELPRTITSIADDFFGLTEYIYIANEDFRTTDGDACYIRHFVNWPDYVDTMVWYNVNIPDGIKTVLNIPTIDATDPRHAFLPGMFIPVSVTKLPPINPGGGWDLNIYYEGTEEQWQNVDVEILRPGATNIHYNSSRFYDIDNYYYYEYFIMNF